MQFKHTILLALFTIHSSLFALHAAVPLRWTVETSRAQVAQFEAYRGETLALEAALNSYGKPLEGVLQPTLYWQTNGMGAAWWTATATASGNVLRATWSPTNDCGAMAYNCFIGGPESTYRAAFRLRMLPSPGYTPNHLPLPTVKAESDPVFSAWLATNEFSSAGVDTNAVRDLISAATNDMESAGTNRQIMRAKVAGPGDDYYNMEGPYYKTLVERSVRSSSAEYDGNWNRFEEYYASQENLSGLAIQLDTLSDTVSAWQTYWDGDDVRDTVTNYYGSQGIPARYLEQKMPPDETHEKPWFRIVWDERTRWNAFMPGYEALCDFVNNHLADRAWGVYDSSTGEYSPDGLLQLSQDQILIAPGMSYQKTVTAGGSSIWVLKATGPVSFSGETENGYFRIQDGDGNSLFEIVKGDKRTVGATATGLEMQGTSMRITYSVESGEHPTLEICTDLHANDWASETATTAAMVSWSGASGNWVATVTPIGARPRLFAKATYEAGGNTYIRNNVATSIDKVVVGGIEYTVTVETVNGKKLLVLQ